MFRPVLLVGHLPPLLDVQISIDLLSTSWLVGVFGIEIGLLFARERSQCRLIESNYDCHYHIFWTGDCCASQLCWVVHHQKPQCLVKIYSVSPVDAVWLCACNCAETSGPAEGHSECTCCGEWEHAQQPEMSHPIQLQVISTFGESLYVHIYIYVAVFDVRKLMASRLNWTSLKWNVWCTCTAHRPRTQIHTSHGHARMLLHAPT